MKDLLYNLSVFLTYILYFNIEVSHTIQYAIQDWVKDRLDLDLLSAAEVI